MAALFCIGSSPLFVAGATRGPFGRLPKSLCDFGDRTPHTLVGGAQTTLTARASVRADRQNDLREAWGPQGDTQSRPPEALDRCTGVTGPVGTARNTRHHTVCVGDSTTLRLCLSIFLWPGSSFEFHKIQVQDPGSRSRSRSTFVHHPTNPFHTTPPLSRMMRHDPRTPFNASAHVQHRLSRPHRHSHPYYYLLTVLEVDILAIASLASTQLQLPLHTTKSSQPPNATNTKHVSAISLAQAVQITVCVGCCTPKLNTESKKRMCPWCLQSGLCSLSLRPGVRRHSVTADTTVTDRDP